jgi:MtN3 and saliva related transmembrane protein
VTPLVDAIGYAAGTLATLAFVPQVVKTWRTKSVDDLSFVMLATFTTGVALWLVYGVMVGSWPIVIANAVTLGLNVVLVVLKVSYGSRRGNRV